LVFGQILFSIWDNLWASPNNCSMWMFSSQPVWSTPKLGPPVHMAENSSVICATHPINQPNVTQWTSSYQVANTMSLNLQLDTCSCYYNFVALALDNAHRFCRNVSF
jgi:hypothetical protein